MTTISVELLMLLPKDVNNSKKKIKAKKWQPFSSPYSAPLTPFLWYGPCFQDCHHDHHFCRTTDAPPQERQ